MDILDRFKEIINPIYAPIVLEFGNCDGYHSRIMLDILKEKCGHNSKYIFHSFEPNQDMIRPILSKMECYLTSNENVKLYNEAVGTKNEKVMLYKSGGEIENNGIITKYNGSSSIRKPKKIKEVWNEMTFSLGIAEVVSLDYHIQRSGLKDKVIDFIWSSVNGCEGDVIIGGKNTFKNVRYLYTKYVNNEWYEGQIGLKEMCYMLPSFEIIEDYQYSVLFKNKNL